MDTTLRSTTRSPIRKMLAFVGVFLVLYICAAAIAERVVGRQGTDSAFQKLLAAKGESVDWLVLGASHALPLEYGGVPARLRQDTGQSMLVLAETGAGPLYNRFVFEQALHDLELKHLLYVIDSFAFGAEDWNETRLTDRALLRRTPLRASTARFLARMSLSHAVDLGGLLDYLTAFSKLNTVDRFPQKGWRGAETFDRRFRPSRHAVSARMSYLYPNGAPKMETVDRYLNSLENMFDFASAAGVAVTVVKLPMPDLFREGLPDEATFDTALVRRLNARGVTYHDLSAAIPDPAFYFDTDHLNSEGVAALYGDHLSGLLTSQ